MSSINKILNDALDQTLLTESKTNTKGNGYDANEFLDAESKRSTGYDANEFLDAEKTARAKKISDALKRDGGLVPGTGDMIRATANKAGRYATSAAKNPWVQGSAAIGAGIGALLLAKKLRAKKKAAAKKKARA